MQSIKFSLIMATYGREKEVGCFLESLTNSNYDMNNVEVIIVDQNKEINLEPIVNRYKEKVKIIHIKSDEKGLALNRNKGLEVATGDIIAFPDDDCEYLKETLNIVNDLFNKEQCDLLMGRIVERNGEDSLRVWSKERIEINKNNFYTKCSSVTMFLDAKKCFVKFNPKLGSGQYFGACEDADLIYKNCKRGSKVIYNPELQIYHPHYDSNSNMDDKKIYSYGLGFGAMVKSNFDMSMLILFTKAEGYHFLKALIALLTLKGDKSKRSWLAFSSRIKGFFEYKN